jgi:RNA polymerase sigma factor (sigma-70 family)
VNPDWNEKLSKVFEGLQLQPDSQEQWGAFYQHVWSYLYAANSRRLHDHGLAQDITQEVLVNVLDQVRDGDLGLDRFKTAQRFLSYLVVAGQHRIIDYSRHAGRETSTDNLETRADSRPSPEQQVLAAEQQALAAEFLPTFLPAFLATLSPFDQEIVLLLAQGFKPHEINEIMAYNPPTGQMIQRDAIYKRISRIRIKARAFRTEREGARSPRKDPT